MNYSIMDSPVGPLTIAGDDDGLHYILFAVGKGAAKTQTGWEESDRGAVREAISQLQLYFSKRLTRFNLPLQPAGTQFQLSVWRELQGILYGEVISYGELASRIGKPKSARAVGAANGANPLPIVVPCHRVIGSDGRLTGYGGGLSVKEALLRLEGARLF